MPNEVAEMLKKSGNDAYAAKRYEDAVVMYEKAIEADPTNYVYYNNRSAAYQQLKQYDKAIADAKKSLELEDNYRGHYRIAAALWAQHKLTEARAEFEKALHLEPSNQNTKDSISMIEKEMAEFVRRASSGGAGGAAGTAMSAEGIPLAPPQGGEFTVSQTGTIGLFADLSVVVVGIAFALSTFLKPATSRSLWNTLMSLTIAQQMINMKAQGILQFNMNVLSVWTKRFSSLLMVLCFFAILTGVSSQLLIGGFIAFYATISLSARRAELGTHLGPIYRYAAPYLEKIGTHQEKYCYLASTLEAIYVFAIPLVGGTWFTLVYIQYAINRYKTDRFVQLAYGSLRANISSTAERYLPAVCTHYLQKLFDLFYLVSQQSI